MIRPTNWPDKKEMVLSPRALPRSSGGNASVRMAALLEKVKDAPTPWTRRNAMISRAPALPLSGVRKSRMDPRVKMANPRLYSFTLPYISESRPQERSRVAVTRLYPISTQMRYWNEVSGSMLMPLKIAGSEMRVMLPFTETMNISMVVMERTTHLQSIPFFTGPAPVFSVSVSMRPCCPRCLRASAGGCKIQFTTLNLENYNDCSSRTGSGCGRPGETLKPLSVNHSTETVCMKYADIDRIYQTLP